MKEFVIGKNDFLPDGAEIRTKVLNPLRLVTPGSTAIHEATHAVVAEVNGTSVEAATINPTAEYQGQTKLSAYNAIAAVAPHADGLDGTGFDMDLVEYVSGGSDGAIAAAKPSISANRDKIYAVASLLEEKGSAGGDEIRERMKRASQGDDILIEVISRDGEVNSAVERNVKNNVFMLPERLYPVKKGPLSKAA